MAYDPANLSSTPAGYQTPEQIQQLYDYSKKLTEGGMRDQTITSPWQGVRMMADALSGNIMRNRAQQAQMHNLSLDKQIVGSQNPPFSPQQYTTPPAPWWSGQTPPAATGTAIRTQGNDAGSQAGVDPVAALFSNYSVG